MLHLSLEVPFVDDISTGKEHTDWVHRILDINLEASLDDLWLHK